MSRSVAQYHAFGRSQTLQAWGREYDRSPSTLRLRLKLGIPLEEALTMPVRETGARAHRDDIAWDPELGEDTAWMGGGLTFYGQQMLRRRGRG